LDQSISFQEHIATAWNQLIGFFPKANRYSVAAERGTSTAFQHSEEVQALSETSGSDSTGCLIRWQ
jgi:hypothetical protein